MSRSITLTGVTWNHSRGYTPLVATAQRFMDEHPDVTIEWQRQSLKDFGDFPIERLAETFDLLVIDHPFAGYAAAHPVLLPLDEHLPEPFLADLAANSVGASYASYVEGGQLWALPIDAAAPVSGYRPDLLDRHDLTVPKTWDELLGLARRGVVTVPAAPVDCLMNFYMLCFGLGEEPFQCDEIVVSPDTGIEALISLREFIEIAGPENINRNPIRTWEALSRTDRYVYCPFSYGYSNYGRSDFTTGRLRFGGLITFRGTQLRSTLGGTGLAISANCREITTAAEYAQYVASAECQRGFYTLTGGQPGHRTAWLDSHNNDLCNGFFVNTLQTLDDSYLRPRYSGYIPFQDHAGDVVRDYLRDGADPQTVLAAINELYRKSRGNA